MKQDSKQSNFYLKGGLCFLAVILLVQLIILPPSATARINDPNGDECDFDPECDDFDGNNRCPAAYYCQFPRSDASTCRLKADWATICGTPAPTPGPKCSTSGSTECDDCLDQQQNNKCDFDAQCVVNGNPVPRRDQDLCAGPWDNSEESYTTAYPTIYVYTNFRRPNASGIVAFNIRIISGKQKGRNIFVTWGELVDTNNPYWKYRFTYTTGSLFGEGEYIIVAQDNVMPEPRIYNNYCKPYNGSPEIACFDDRAYKTVGWSLEYTGSTTVALLCNETAGPAGTSCSVNYNSPVYFTWSSTGAQTCTATSGPWTGSVPSSKPVSHGSPGEQSQNITASTTATIQCSGTLNGIPSSAVGTVSINMRPTPTMTATPPPTPTPTAAPPTPSPNATPVAQSVSVEIGNYCSLTAPEVWVRWNFSDPNL